MGDEADGLGKTGAMQCLDTLGSLNQHTTAASGANPGRHAPGLAGLRVRSGNHDGFAEAGPDEGLWGQHRAIAILFDDGTGQSGDERTFRLDSIRDTFEA